MTKKIKSDSETVARRVEVNDQHPDFNWPLEILCCLPPAPNWAEVQFIAEGFGMEIQEIDDSIALLRRKGYNILERRINGSRVRSVSAASWRKAKKVADNYWGKVYGPKTDQPD